MKKTFLIISVLLGILFYPVNAQQRIVEGSNINISEVPWQVAIQTKGVFNGGGSILAPNLILTAAHVVEKYTAKEVKVGVGSSKYWCELVFCFKYCLSPFFGYCFINIV